LAGEVPALKPEPPLEPSNPVMDTGRAASAGDMRLPEAAATVVPRSGPQAVPGAEVDERELVARSRDRDEEAFGVLVRMHQDRAVGLAFRITRSRADAEDVAQEAFVRAWLALPGFRGDAAFGTWLHRIVARRALDRAQSLRSRRAREAPLDDAGVDPPAVSRTAGAPGDPLLAARLERLVGRLSPPQRAVVALFYLRDHAVEDIAGTLDMPENTVKTHLARARTALREAWEREGGRDT